MIFMSIINSRYFYGLECGGGECMKKMYEKVNDQNEKLQVFIVMVNTIPPIM